MDGGAGQWEDGRKGAGGIWQTAQCVFRDAGTYTVWYKVSAANHEDIVGSFTVSITRAVLTVIIGDAEIAYGEEAPESFDVTYRGFVGRDDESVLEGELVFTVIGYSVGSPAGTYAVEASGYTADNYDIMYQSGLLYVTQVAITVTITTGGGTYGEEIVPATATLHGVPAGADVHPILTYTGTANDGTSYQSKHVTLQEGRYTDKVTHDH